MQQIDPDESLERCQILNFENSEFVSPDEYNNHRRSFKIKQIKYTKDINENEFW